MGPAGDRELATSTVTAVKPAAFQILPHSIAPLGVISYQTSLLSNACLTLEEENAKKSTYVGVSVQTHMSPWHFSNFYPVMDICGVCHT